MTGAAAPDSEVARYMGMFFPSPADDDATKLNKLQRAQSWVNGILEQLRVGRPQLQGGNPVQPAPKAGPRVKLDWQGNPIQ
jgi:hypothetical protein